MGRMESDSGIDTIHISSDVSIKIPLHSVRDYIHGVGLKSMFRDNVWYSYLEN